MNGRILVSKPLYVALAQRKEDRKAQLASQYMQRMAGMRMQQMGQMFQPGGPGYFMPAPIQPQRFYTPAQMAQFRATPRWSAQPQVRPNAQLNQQGAGYPMSAQYRGGVPPRGQPPAVRSMQSARPITGQQPMGVPQGMGGRSMGMPQGGPVMPQPRPSGFKFTPAMRNPPNQVVPLFCFSRNIVQYFKILIVLGFDSLLGGWSSIWRYAASLGRPGSGAFDGFHACLCCSQRSEADAGRTSLPADPAYVPGHGRKDHWHVVGDRQLGAVAHARAPRITQSQGMLSS